MIIQLHGAGERGEGEHEPEKVLIHGFADTAGMSGLHDCILVMPQCPCETFWVAKIEGPKVFIDEMALRAKKIPTKQIHF